MAKTLLFIAGSDIDYFYDVENFLAKGDACIAKPIGKKVGGCVLNAASVCSMLGSDVKVIDYLKKDDEDTKLLTDELVKRHVDISNIKYGLDVINGTCLIMKKDDEKCIYVIEPKRPYFNDDEYLDILKNSSYIYTLMATLKLSFKDLSIIDKARNAGCKLIFDGGSQYQNDEEKDILLNYADGIFMNETSFKRLRDKCDFDPLGYMFNRGLEFACITSGSEGCKCYTKDNVYFETAKRVDVIDSTGAGDSFAGSFLHFLNERLDIKDCLRYASYSGAYACSKQGGMAGAISKDELDAFIDGYR